MKTLEIHPSGHGHFKISIEFRGKKISAITTNTIAIDRIRNENLSSRNRKEYGCTLKQAIYSLINEIKRNN